MLVSNKIFEAKRYTEEKLGMKMKKPSKKKRRNHHDHASASLVDKDELYVNAVKARREQYAKFLSVLTRGSNAGGNGVNKRSRQIIQDFFYSESQALELYHWHRIVIDEVHEYGQVDPHTKEALLWSKPLMGLSGKHRWGLSATPPMDLQEINRVGLVIGVQIGDDSYDPASSFMDTFVRSSSYRYTCEYYCCFEDSVFDTFLWFHSITYLFFNVYFFFSNSTQFIVKVLAYACLSRNVHLA